jgi:carbon starvation protein
MNGAWLLAIGAVYFLAAYFLYGGRLMRLFGVDPTRPTPAHTQRDGVDYVPTHPAVLFGHHFASIAGAGPIVGPIMASYYGWLPVVLWVTIGCVFFGAMHDFAALFLSVRHGGRSIGHLIEDQLGYAGRQVFLVFSWATLVLVVAVFAMLVAKTFVASPAAATASLLFVALAPPFGFLVYRRGVSVRNGSLVFVPAMFAMVWVGVCWPLDLAGLFGLSADASLRVWLAVLLAYAFVASTIPVWLLLQPRDYLNSFLLYAMIAMGLAGILVARPSFQLPAFVGLKVVSPAGSPGKLFPLLFITVACGAISGFHALVASGTTAKQLNSERDIRPVGYGAMLVEGLLALMALTTVAALGHGEYAAMLGQGGPGPVAAFATGLAGFATRLGVRADVGSTFVSLAISAFLLTTLDTATRLGRFAWQELFLARGGAEAPPARGAVRLVSNRFTATSVVVAFSAWLALSGNAQHIWQVFGASNQLLAALTLLGVTLALRRMRKPTWPVAGPMVFMMVICLWALVDLVVEQMRAPRMNVALTVVSIFLATMAVELAIMAGGALTSAGKERPAEAGSR